MTSLETVPGYFPVPHILDVSGKQSLSYRRGEIRGRRGLFRYFLVNGSKKIAIRYLWVPNLVEGYFLSHRRAGRTTDNWNEFEVEEVQEMESLTDSLIIANFVAAVFYSMNTISFITLTMAYHYNPVTPRLCH